MMQLPFLTACTSGIGGSIKECSEDFIVHEKLKYPCSGKGDFLYLEIEKENITTFEVIRLLRKYLKLKKNDVGYAGIKDARAKTTQFFSLFKVSETALEKLQNIPGFKIIGTNYHNKKLKLGNIEENEFSILIRNTNGNIADAKKILSILEKKGVPNFFGKQRFGTAENTHLMGKQLLLKNYDALMQILFSTSQVDGKSPQQFKLQFHEKKYQEAYENVPHSFQTEKTILRALMQNKSIEYAVSTISRQMKYFYICAYQSYLFNCALIERLQSIDVLQYGDLAVLHPSRSVFLVDEPEKEQPRCNEKQISPSGPLFGFDMIQPKGVPFEIEQQILAKENLDLYLFRDYKIPGERRTFRFFIKNPTIYQQNNDIMIRFSLPTGCYATSVLREVMKTNAL